MERTMPKVPQELLQQVADAFIGKQSPRPDHIENACAQCDGRGVLSADKYEDGEVSGRATWECDACGGTGIERGEIN